MICIGWTKLSSHIFSARMRQVTRRDRQLEEWKLMDGFSYNRRRISSAPTMVVREKQHFWVSLARKTMSCESLTGSTALNPSMINCFSKELARTLEAAAADRSTRDKLDNE